jgi:hypothetical protein
MTSRQIPTRICKSVLSTLPPYFLQVVSARAFSVLEALTKLIGGLAAHAAPIVLPIVATLFLVKWIYDVYGQSYVFLAMPC